jgi:hypothetical protein
MAGIEFTKKRAGLPRLAIPRALLGPVRRARDQDAGNSTVSTTWITPFDWLTFEIVTVEVPPLASTIQTLPSGLLDGQFFAFGGLELLAVGQVGCRSLPGTT